VEASSVIDKVGKLDAVVIYDRSKLDGLAKVSDKLAVDSPEPPNVLSVYEIIEGFPSSTGGPNAECLSYMTVLLFCK